MRTLHERGATLNRPGPGLGTTALERLFHEHHGVVFRAAYRVTGNASDSEDALQTVFVRLAARPNLPAITPAYLARAGVNAGLDLMRSRSVRGDAGPPEDLDRLLAGPDAHPESRRETREVRGRLRLALAGLSPKLAEIFCLRHLEGLPNREIAIVVGMSAASVAVQLFRARARLRAALRPEV